MTRAHVLALLALCTASYGAGCDSGSTKSHAPAIAPLRIVLIADLEGVLEPCGCTSRPLGGVDRLAAAVAELRRGAHSALVLASGDLFAAAKTATVAAPRTQDKWQADVLAAVLGRMGIDVVASGAGDRERAPERTAALALAGRAILLGKGAANAALDAMVPSARLRIGEIEIGVVSIEPVDAKAVVAGAQQVAALRSGGAQLVIAFVDGGAEAAHAVAAGVGSDFVVHSGDWNQAPAVSATANGALLLHAGHHGEHVLALDVWPGDEARPWSVVTETEPVPNRDRTVVASIRELGRNAAADPAVRELLDQLFARINTHNADAYWEATPPAPGGKQAGYVGSRTCAACHTQAYFWWQQTPHARAFDTLTARRRQLDLDCIGCHVTGYQQPGGSSVGRLDELKGVGCESCHGPGGAHVDNPRQRGRAILREVPERTCTACHDPEHSDLFRYAQARGRLLALGHGKDARP